MAFRYSVQSTSSTSLGTHSREVLDLSPLAVVGSIHSALVIKSYQRRSKVDPSVLESLSNRLIRRVQSDVKNTTRKSLLKRPIDWEIKVFRPMIATFDIQEKLGICIGDTEYVFLLATILLLAYEILIDSGKAKAPITRSFLARAFHEYFSEPEICSRISEVLESERKRLAESLADIRVLRAIQDLRMLLPDIALCTAAWNASMTQSTSYRRPRDSIFNAFDRSHTSQKIELPISRWDEASSRKTVLFALPEYPPATSADIRVKVFLKPGRSWPFEFVTSIELHDDSATMRTSIGLSMQLEGWSSISAISENHDTMAVQMPKGSADGFTANVIIPPLCSYSVAKVIDVKEKAGITGWTIIDTAEAVLEVSDGNYLVKRKYFESVVIIENTS